MCIVIDICALASVFRAASDDQDQFRPVYDWIFSGKRKGKIVYGGTKYKKELRKMPNYEKILHLLDWLGKTVTVEDAEVDLEQEKVEDRLQDKNFNDPHIVAIVIVSKCCLVCTTDKKSHRFLKDKKCYPRGFKAPRIYPGPGNRNLLTDANMAAICKAKPGTKALQR